MSGWKEINATQEQTNDAFRVLALIYSVLSRQNKPSTVAEVLITDFGICSCVLVDREGKEIGIRILPDTTTLSYVDSFEFLI